MQGNYLGVSMSEKSEDTLKKVDIDALDKSIFNLPPGRIEESITPLKIHWVALENLNDVLAGNYVSIILFGLSTAFLGAWLASLNETQKYFCGLFGVILLIISVALHVVFVSMRIHKWKKEAIRRSDVK